MQEKFRKLLHEYKVNAFRVSHEPKSAEELAKEILTFTDETLSNAYHYHFHKLPDAQRAEIINTVNNYVLQSLLPPVVEKILKRQVVLEKKQEMTIKLLEQVLDILSEGGSFSKEMATHRS